MDRIVDEGHQCLLEERVHQRLDQLSTYVSTLGDRGNGGVRIVQQELENSAHADRDRLFRMQLLGDLSNAMEAEPQFVDQFFEGFWIHHDKYIV